MQLHVFILQADPSAAQIALVDVLPEADRKFLHALDVRRADAHCRAVEADGSQWIARDAASPQASGNARLPQPPWTPPTVQALAWVCSWP